jgi:hypothetical protein
MEVGATIAVRQRGKAICAGNAIQSISSRYSFDRRFRQLPLVQKQ